MSLESKAGLESGTEMSLFLILKYHMKDISRTDLGSGW